jgi:hypothetical protein
MRQADTGKPPHKTISGRNNGKTDLCDSRFGTGAYYYFQLKRDGPGIVIGFVGSSSAVVVALGDRAWSRSLGPPQAAVGLGFFLRRLVPGEARLEGQADTFSHAIFDLASAAEIVVCLVDPCYASVSARRWTALA